MIGSTILHFKILEKLGQGGMGIVYLAEDLKLERKVAIKFLPKHISENTEERQRFKIEAKAAAKLNHPNIAAIYSIEETENELFIVMEYIKGKELKEIVETHRDASLQRDEIIKIATQIADGLDAAHKERIIHRDIKSSNIMITESGVVKIMDFGLAKIKGTSKLTKLGSTVGTIAYMSPEQTMGEEVDQRTDIWSFGVVLYEMLTGKMPFRGDYDQAIIYSIINEAPVAIRHTDSNMQGDLVRILYKMLEKNPESRYQSASLLLNDLNSLKSGSSLKSKVSSKTKFPFSNISKRRRFVIFISISLLIVIIISALIFNRMGISEINSIAVLPFTNVNGNPNAEYLSDGITENLINNLSGNLSMRVIPRNTAFTFKGHIDDLEDIGRKLNVQAVVTGRVFQQGENLNIQIDLIDIKRQAELWGNQYSGKTTDLIKIQEQIAIGISHKLNPVITSNNENPQHKKYSENTEAYQLYLKGRYYWNQRQYGPAKPIEYFNEAIEKDSNYAPAYVGLADCYFVSAIWESGSLAPLDADPIGKKAISKALQLDDSLAEAHASLGFYFLNYAWNWPEAEKEFKKAIALNPKYPTAHHWYSHYLTAMGRTKESLNESQKALKLDPLDDVLNAHLAWNYIFSRQYDKAIDQCKKMIEFKPNSYEPHFYFGWALQQKKMFNESISEFQKAFTLNPNATYVIAAMGYVYALQKKPDEAKIMLDQLLNSSKHKYVDAYSFALIYVGLGDKDRAFEWLNKAYKENSNWLSYLKVEPRLDPLRSDHRFKDLLDKVGLL
jgi:serine/threonine protein kinase/Tfp pilus assembly protein PilF